MIRKDFAFELLVLVIVILMAWVNLAFADSATLKFPFAGVITELKAPEVKKAERENYFCFIKGISITVKNKGGVAGQSSSYIIPSGVSAKSGKKVAAGNQIMGLYGGKTYIVCTQKGLKKAKTIRLNTIKIFDTSSGLVL